MKVIGIDPGLSGAIAVLEDKKVLGIFDMPVMAEGKKNKRQLNSAQLVNVIKSNINQDEEISVVVEQVNAMPGQGVTSMFNFGQTFGAIKGVCAALKLPIYFRPTFNEGVVQECSKSFEKRYQSCVCGSWPQRAHTGSARFKRASAAMSFLCIDCFVRPPISPGPASRPFCNKNAWLSRLNASSSRMSSSALSVTLRIRICALMCSSRTLFTRAMAAVSLLCIACFLRPPIERWALRPFCVRPMLGENNLNSGCCFFKVSMQYAT